MSLYPSLVLLDFTNFNFTIQLSTFFTAQNILTNTPFFSIWRSKCQDIMWPSSLLITLIDLVIFASFFQFQQFMYYIFLFVLHFYSYVLHFHFLPLSFFKSPILTTIHIFIFYRVSFLTLIFNSTVWLKVRTKNFNSSTQYSMLSLY